MHQCKRKRKWIESEQEGRQYTSYNGDVDMASNIYYRKRNGRQATHVATTGHGRMACNVYDINDVI